MTYIQNLFHSVVVVGFAQAKIIPVPTAEYPTIQAGIDAAVDGDVVLVANGTYVGSGNKDLRFNGKKITVESEHGPEDCIIDCEGSGRGFYFHSGETSASVVSGFTIRNGYAGSGGGIYCYKSSPTITNNIIEGNTASNGGGIYCYYSSSPTISNNIIEGNTGNSDGGRIYCNSSSPTITNNTIEGNTAGSLGEGIGCFANSSPMIENNISIMGNSASYGGGIYCQSSSPTIKKNIIIENFATFDGGGINCDSVSSPTLVNNIIAWNIADGNGGGVYCYDSTPTIKHNTITLNEASNGGGISCWYDTHPMIVNTILWADNPNEIYLDASSTIDITYSDIQGGWEGEGNINADPFLVDPFSGDYHLRECSPCIGAGMPDVGVDEDFEDDLRPNPEETNPDIGADEHPLAEPISCETGVMNGYVTDCQTGNPIKRAIVIVINLKTKEKFSDITDDAGYCEFPELLPGVYLAIAIKKGYKPGVAKLKLEAGKTITHDFCLEPKEL